MAQTDKYPNMATLRLNGADSVKICTRSAKSRKKYAKISPGLGPGDVWVQGTHGYLVIRNLTITPAYLSQFHSAGEDVLPATGVLAAALCPPALPPAMCPLQSSPQHCGHSSRRPWPVWRALAQHWHSGEQFNSLGWKSNYPLVQVAPSLAALAREGVVLEQHYSQSTCSPSRAALLTGR